MNHQPDKTYKSIWSSFKTVIDLARLNSNLPVGEKYLTKENIDYFYKHHVAFSKNCPSTVRKIRGALQYYVNRVEYFDHPENRFVIGSSTIDDALLQQQGRYTEASLISTVDPHAKIPTNTLTNEDHVKAMSILFNSSISYWKSLALSWTLGSACLIRPDTFIKLRLPSLYLDTRHIPPSGDNFTVSYALYPSDLKGGRNNGKGVIRVVGSWRHKEYKRCAVGYLAMILFVSLRNDTNLNFYIGGRRNGRPEWWDRRLLDEWKDASTLSHCYRRFLDYSGIDHNKCSYLRTSGIDECGYEGELFQDQIGTMSKHTTKNSKLDVHYMTELYPPVLRVLAGFLNGSAYSVPRTEIVIDWSDEESLTKLVFPLIESWKMQIQSRNGDKSKAAHNFVYLLLPALAKIVVQDGIYWIRDFPNHIVSRYLLAYMPSSYERWALDKREWARQVCIQRNQVAATNVNSVTQSLVYSFQRDLLGVKKDVIQRQAATDVKITEIRDILLESRNNLGINDNTSTLTNKFTEDANRNNEVKSRPANNVNNFLRNTRLLPAFPTVLPKTIHEVLNQHQSLQ